MEIKKVIENYESINQFIQMQQNRQSEFEPIIKQNLEQISELDQRREKLEGENKKKAVLLEEQEKSVKVERALHYKQKEEIENQQKVARQKLNIANVEVGKVMKNDLYELRMNMNNSNTNPLVKFTLECIAIIIDESQDLDNLKRVLNDQNFLNKIKNLDVVNMSETIDEKFNRKINSNPHFKPQNFKGLTQGARSFCDYCLAI